MPNMRSLRKLPIAWDKDQVEPHNKSSVEIILEWLRTPNNYELWRGVNEGPILRKAQLLDKILANLAEAGIDHRKSQDVRTKISTLENEYYKAKDWLSKEAESEREKKAAEGADREDIEDHIQEMVTKKCRLFDELDPIFGELPPPKAPTTRKARSVRASTLIHHPALTSPSTSEPSPSTPTATPTTAPRRIAPMQPAFRYQPAYERSHGVNGNVSPNPSAVSHGVNVRLPAPIWDHRANPSQNSGHHLYTSSSNSGSDRDSDADSDSETGDNEGVTSIREGQVNALRPTQKKRSAATLEAVIDLLKANQASSPEHLEKRIKLLEQRLDMEQEAQIIHAKAKMLKARMYAIEKFCQNGLHVNEATRKAQELSE